MLNNNNNIHPSGHLQSKPCGQKEFAMLDPNNNLLTFGQGIKDKNKDHFHYKFYRIPAH